MEFVTEIPSYLKQLARLVAQGFYQREDALIIDMLVRNACMKEKDIEELLKFDLKSLRARLATLKIEKFVQLRLRMETGVDGKAQKVNYYFINYKSLVNVIKYKLDHMRKRMETQERDATNRASFKCTNCIKTFTDLEAGELFDPMVGQFRCTFCKQPVEEDETTGPKKDSRLMLARFNDQMEILYELLRKAEDIRLAPELLEPEPPRGPNENGDNNQNQGRDRNGMWSGEATRMRGLNDQTKIDFKIGEADNPKRLDEVKERPIWMFESTIGDQRDSQAIQTGSLSRGETTSDKPTRDDVMSVLLTFEKKGGTLHKPIIPGNESGSEEEDNDVVGVLGKFNGNFLRQHTPMDVDDDEVQLLEDDDIDQEDQVPMVTVGGEKIALSDVDHSVIQRMTAEEKDAYTTLHMEAYPSLYD